MPAIAVFLLAYIAVLFVGVDGNNKIKYVHSRRGLTSAACMLLHLIQL
jgi:hypothetical protein